MTSIQNDESKPEGIENAPSAGNARGMLPSVSNPKGGGAIRGIDEKFSVDNVTGTANITIPIHASPSRSSFDPHLSLKYDSGSGNGPFGLGWTLNIPSITRKTSKGIPKYRDEMKSDVFILTDAEDLVPILEQVNGKWQKASIIRNFKGMQYRVQRYKPRIEGLFALIEHWTNLATGESHWRSISKDNICSIYGRTSASRIANPADLSQTFSWLICESYDDKGNAILFEYKAENSQNVDLSSTRERNMTDDSRTACRFLKRIKYGNKTPRKPSEDLYAHNEQDWMFEVVFDYGEHYLEDEYGMPVFVSIDDAKRHWHARKDPFSIFRPGFEVRTYRLCKRILMFHHFLDQLGIRDYLVGSTEFGYDDNPVASFLTTIRKVGYVLKNGNKYIKKSLPPLEFRYSQPMINREIREIDSESLENMPYGLDGTHYQWVDLDGEGLAGILAKQDQAWFYKRNLSGLRARKPGDKQLNTARFGPGEMISLLPLDHSINTGSSQLMDLDGDGQLELVKFEGSKSGFYDRVPGGWKPYVTFKSIPNVDWNHPDLRFIDLTGDGHADMLITEQQKFAWYHSLAKEGFGAADTVAQFLNEEKGPSLVFSDNTQSIYIADMSGDGLPDLVRIRNGAVCYWPNLGYGRFGAKICMNNSPLFDTYDQFDNRRIRLADTDGSGTPDITYLGQDGVKLYYNQSGNGWSNPHMLYEFPLTDNLSSVSVLDLLGSGTACLVWSSALPGETSRSMRYIDLMGGGKPHLLVSIKNNMGKETSLKYTSSTRFYLQDKEEGKPWITNLSFPVHVVEEVETFDQISGNLFVARYKYHEGCFDGIEREFRGFGFVEELDTEDFASLSSYKFSRREAPSNIQESSYNPPVLTKTWLHTGMYSSENTNSRHSKMAYYREPNLSETQFERQLLQDTIMPEGLTSKEQQEACRALKGSLLRQEVYALDESVKSSHPYKVTERNYTIKVLQRQEINEHGVFFVHPRETIDYNYERNPTNPRISHSMFFDVDNFGNTLKVANIGYGCRTPDPSLSEDEQTKQAQILATYTSNLFTNNIDSTNSDDSDDSYRTPQPYLNSRYEITGIKNCGDSKLDFSALYDCIAESEILPYEMEPSGSLEIRLIEQVVTLYRKNDLSSSLRKGIMESLALVYEIYKLALTPKLLRQIYVDHVSESTLSVDGGYVHLDGDENWWIPSGKVFYSPSKEDPTAAELSFAKTHFFLPHRYEDAFGSHTTIRYDDYSLLVKESRDALDNLTTVVTYDNDGKQLEALDYRVLEPWNITDPNGNRTAVIYDSLGFVAFKSIMGKIDEIDGVAKGDAIPWNLEVELSAKEIENLHNDPCGMASKLLGSASSRILICLDSFYDTQDSHRPVYTVNLTRETHAADEVDNKQSRIQIRFSYFDGFGREIQNKSICEPDEGSLNPRWRGSGWMAFNNKGLLVKRYESFISESHKYEFGRNIGVSPAFFYDPLGRLVVTLHPNHTYEKVIFDAWKSEIWDVNDNILHADPATDKDVGIYFSQLTETEYSPTWHMQRKDGQRGPEEQEAAKDTEEHFGTPKVAYFDSLGRSFVTVVDNGKFGKYKKTVKLDIEGNREEVIDEYGRLATLYKYDISGNRLYHASMDAGERWILNDVIGKVIYNWDSLGRVIRTSYDELRRPLVIFLQEGMSHEKIIERSVYGEPIGKSRNHKGRIYQLYDGAGIVTYDAYDFKGNLISSSRQITSDYKNLPDWSKEESLEPGIYNTTSEFDALNRLVRQTTPDKTTVRFFYNERGLVESIDANPSDDIAKSFVRFISYNARGQRTSIRYGNDVITKYKHDPETFRLIHLQTLRGEEKLQDLFYTYDPAGNITAIKDHSDTQKPIFFRHRRVEANSKYKYDPIYRLRKATGREHLGQADYLKLHAPEQIGSSAWDKLNVLHPRDGNALGRYLENYEYDKTGNITLVRHLGSDASNPCWTRSYEYDENSLINPKESNNRLSSTTVGNTTYHYDYDIHGSVVYMPHLPAMKWNYRNLLQSSSRQKVDNGKIPETTYYVYDSSGQRVRKVTETFVSGINEVPRIKEERLYLENFEIYRAYRGDGKGIKLERETLHIMDDTHRVAIVEKRTKGDDGSPPLTIRYQLGNHIGSSSLELTQDGEIITFEEYYPFGGTSYQAGYTLSEIKLKRYRYIGKELDEETAMYYYGARYYASWLARWVSCDPQGVEEGNNLYAYVDNRPIIAIDPDGRIIWFIVIGAIALTTVTVVSPANAPTSPSSPTYPSISNEQFAAHVAVNAVSLATGAGITKLFKAVPALGVPAGGAAMGAVQGGGHRAVSDAWRSQISSFGEYLHDIGTGAGYGALFAGFLYGVGRVLGFNFSRLFNRPSGEPPATRPQPSAPEPAAPPKPAAPEPTAAPEPAAPPKPAAPEPTAAPEPAAIPRPTVPPTTEPTGFGGYVSTWTGSPKAIARFEPFEEGRVVVTDLFNRFHNPVTPKGSGGVMLADALKSANLGRPTYIRGFNIINEPTVAQLAAGIHPSETIIGKTLSTTAKELGAKIVKWTTGVYRGKPWIEIHLEYPGQ